MTESCEKNYNSFENGKVRCTGQGLAETCEFVCDENFDLIGQYVVRCEKNDDGKLSWNSEKPKCIAPLPGLFSIEFISLV